VSALTLHLCDPSRPWDDHVTLSVSLATRARTNVLVFPAGPTVLFRVPYTRAAPPSHAP